VPAGWRRAGVLWLAGYIGIVLLVILAVLIVPPPSGPVAVVTLPGAAPAALVVAAAGGTVLQTTAGEHVALAQGEGTDFAARLYAAGATLVAAPGLVALCGRPSSAASFASSL
jgi:uncharacterized integral membrane protein